MMNTQQFHSNKEPKKKLKVVTTRIKKTEIPSFRESPSIEKLKRNIVRLDEKEKEREEKVDQPITQNQDMSALEAEVQDLSESPIKEKAQEENRMTFEDPRKVLREKPSSDNIFEVSDDSEEDNLPNFGVVNPNEGHDNKKLEEVKNSKNKSMFYKPKNISRRNIFSRSPEKYQNFIIREESYEQSSEIVGSKKNIADMVWRENNNAYGYNYKKY